MALERAEANGRDARPGRRDPFAAADVECNRVLAVESVNLVDLEGKTRGLWWGCGGWTTRSYRKPLNTLSPTLWACGKKQVEPFFKPNRSSLTRDLYLELSVLASMNQSHGQQLKEKA